MTNETPTVNNWDMPTDGMTRWSSVKVVKAGEITEVVPAGCYVAESDGTKVLRIYPPKMTERYQPIVGDFWVVYNDGYQSISPRAPFLEGYIAFGPDPSNETEA